MTDMSQMPQQPVVKEPPTQQSVSVQPESSTVSQATMTQQTTPPTPQPAPPIESPAAPAQPVAPTPSAPQVMQPQPVTPPQQPVQPVNVQPIADVTAPVQSQTPTTSVPQAPTVGGPEASAVIEQQPSQESQPIAELSPDVAGTLQQAKTLQAQAQDLAARGGLAQAVEMEEQILHEIASYAHEEMEKSTEGEVAVAADDGSVEVEMSVESMEAPAQGVAPVEGSNTAFDPNELGDLFGGGDAVEPEPPKDDPRRPLTVSLLDAILTKIDQQLLAMPSDAFLAAQKAQLTNLRMQVDTENFGVDISLAKQSLANAVQLITNLQVKAPSPETQQKMQQAIDYLQGVDETLG